MRRVGRMCAGRPYTVVSAPPPSLLSSPPLSPPFPHPPPHHIFAHSLFFPFYVTLCRIHSQLACVFALFFGLGWGNTVARVELNVNKVREGPHFFISLSFFQPLLCILCNQFLPVFSILCPIVVGRRVEPRAPPACLLPGALSPLRHRLFHHYPAGPLRHSSALRGGPGGARGSAEVDDSVRGAGPGRPVARPLDARQVRMRTPKEIKK
jgi:hypothetical protein